MWYILLAAIGIAVILAGAFMSHAIMQRQQNREFDKRLPDRVASHPYTRNSMFALYILIPIVAIVVGILIYMFVQGRP